MDYKDLYKQALTKIGGMNDEELLAFVNPPKKREFKDQIALIDHTLRKAGIHPEYTWFSDDSGGSLEYDVMGVKGDSFTICFSFDKNKSFEAVHVYANEIQVVDSNKIL